MHNIEWKIDGDRLIVTMDISQAALDAAPPSASGKTFLIASTGSAMPLPYKAARSLALSVKRSLALSVNLMAKK